MADFDRISLEALRVFEAAARHSNFSAAARELHVTQAAVSRRIQGLEIDLGSGLFIRRGRRLSLTPQGATLQRRVRAGLDFIGEAIDAFDPAMQGETVALSASGSVSHLWLSPALRAFAGAHPGVSVRLLTTDSMAELAAETNDVAILYGSGAHPRWRLSPLLAETLTPVAAPGYLEANGLTPGSVDLARLSRLDLLDYEPFNAHWITLRDWIAWAGGPRVRPRLAFSTYAMTIEAALRGDGVALGSMALLADPLASGALTTVSPLVWTTGRGYFAGLPGHRTISEAAHAMHAGLLAYAAGAA